MCMQAFIRGKGLYQVEHFMIKDVHNIPRIKLVHEEVFKRNCKFVCVCVSYELENIIKFYVKTLNFLPLKK